MDYPLVTDRQKELGNIYRELCSDLEIKLKETIGSDGSLFLDADVKSDPENLAKTTKIILRRVFGATDNTKLEYIYTT